MSLLDSSDLITIKLCYVLKTTDGSKKLIILDDKKAKQMLADPAKAADVETLTTKWSPLNWREQNDVSNEASSEVNVATGEKQFNYNFYRDIVVKKCLKEWDLTITPAGGEPQPAPVTSEMIDKLPGAIVLTLHQRFEEAISYTESEMGNL